MKKLSQVLLTILGKRSHFTEMTFDQGSYASIALESTDVYRITPIKHYAGKWAWWCLRSNEFTGKATHFLIAKADHFNLAAGEWLACWATSPDTDTWNQFDNVTIGATDIEFYNDTVFPNGTIYISALPMYPYSRVQRLVSELAANALVGETTSTTDNILATMTARDANDGTGRTSPALPLYGMKITSAVANTKNKAVLSAQQHPSETPGAFALEGALNWLIGDTVFSNFLLDWFEFYVYPGRNAQGIYSGYFRVQPQSATPADFTTTGTFEEVDLLKPAIVADINSEADVMLDYHSEMAATDINGVVVNGDTTGQYPIYATAMESLDSDFELTEAAVGAEDGTLGKLLRDTYGVDLYTTLEQGGEVARGITAWKAFGANTLRALTTMLAQGNFPQGPGVGSRDFNGTTDRVDWSSIVDLKDHALTISLWVYLDAIPANGYMFCINQSGDSTVSMYFNITLSGCAAFGVLGTSNLAIASVINTATTDAWLHLLVTWDGVITDYNGVHIYKNGAEATPYNSTTNGSASVTATGKWAIGGRTYDDARNLNGKIAQVGVWNSVLSAGNIANLAAGYAPSLITPAPSFYFKGNTDDLHDQITDALGTADGTTQATGVGNGPSIYYP